eukprot:NODE_112_length_2387_cov_1450.733533_g90_i0.p1 GENE.NODE_112_length_2387_cov_1450.733533_g90_i0~~NODE_112_length_2387_cov_1450.733533_g90_i0.p1  ORF type:complete len:682 (-),score=180.25 NODE_112_length_2387_cov_1450.733533_g90_i0:340-2334(-)
MRKRLQPKRLFCTTLVLTVVFGWFYLTVEQSRANIHFNGRKLLQENSPTPTLNPTRSATRTRTPTPTRALDPDRPWDPTDYPKDVFTLRERLNGAIVLHLLGMVYMFLGLAIICDEYFVPALEVICEALSLKEDVAGATFMAAGGSAPELAASFLGVFVSKSDIGFGTIVGSAVFNVLFVVAGCALVAPNVPLTWWPLARDCSYYSAAIMMVVCFLIDQKIHWYEAMILLFGYAGYVTVMYFNEQLCEFTRGGVADAKADRNRAPWRHKLEKVVDHTLFHIFIYSVIILNAVTIFKESDVMNILNYICAAIFIAEMCLKLLAHGFFGYCTDAMNVFDGVLVALIILELAVLSSRVIGVFRVLRFMRFARLLRLVRLVRMFTSAKIDVGTQWVDGDWDHDYLSIRPVKVVRHNSIAFRRSSKAPEPEPEPDEPEPYADNRVDRDPNQPSEEDAGSDDDEHEAPNPFIVPDGWKSRIYWLIVFPMALCMFVTVPHCKRPRFRKFYMLTFIASVLWIGGLSYVMVWMATLAGVTFNIPPPVMGVTILAAGTSVPDLMESLAVAKRGQGDMAVSSSIGSNVFDLLMGLPLPWFIYGAINNEPVDIASSGLTISVLTLFMMVGVTIATIVFEGWALTKRLAYIMIALYLYFVLQSLLLEYEILPLADEF